jgi:hypothetical protein
MNLTLSLPVQEFIRASERIFGFASNHNGLPEDDWEAVLLNACELIREIEPYGMESHQHDTTLFKQTGCLGTVCL